MRTFAATVAATALVLTAGLPADVNTHDAVPS